MGNGFRFMFGTFCDITYNREANEAACDFIRGKIKEIVKDPETARKLMPWELYARRPVCGAFISQKEHADLYHCSSVMAATIKSSTMITWRWFC